MSRFQSFICNFHLIIYSYKVNNAHALTHLDTSKKTNLKIKSLLCQLPCQCFYFKWLVFIIMFYIGLSTRYDLSHTILTVVYVIG